MARAVMLPGLDREQCAKAADGLAVLLAVSLPWSTTATGIFAALYLIAVVPTLDAERLAAVKASPAAWLPFALAVFGLVGVLWADVPLAERMDGLKSFAKLAFIPLLFMHFSTARRPHWVLTGFFVSCTVLLAASLLPTVVPWLRWMWPTYYGIPVKNHISQGIAFLVCLFVALHLGLLAARAGEWLKACALAALAALFAIDIVYVIVSRTAIAVMPVMVIAFALFHFRWKGIVAVALLGVVAGAAVWTSSPLLRARVGAVVTNAQQYQPSADSTSAGERLEFWRKSLTMIADAPLLGHGTGSIKGQFRVAAGPSGLSSLVAANPHNQTLAVGIQLGLVGIAVLWAMWIAHLPLFWTNGTIAWFGLVVVVETIVGSLFNSMLFDFTEGWIYVVLVGVAAGAVARDAQAEPAREAPS